VETSAICESRGWPQKRWLDEVVRIGGRDWFRKRGGPSDMEETRGGLCPGVVKEED